MILKNISFGVYQTLHDAIRITNGNYMYIFFKIGIDC